MKVKICGITDIETALFAAEQGADAIGFVFAESKRRISVKKAKEIIKKIPTNVLKVGVFVNESRETVQEIVNETGLTAVQFHGDEPPHYCNSFSVKVIKAFSIANTADLTLIHDYDCEYVLLDSPKGNNRGGTGNKFDWELLNGFKSGKKKVILAGGLHPENVAEAIEMTSPFMVDVSTGVETEGKKDLIKIQMFIERAKSREEV